MLLACPGMVYRRDAIDGRHTGTRHQLDLWRVTWRVLSGAGLDQMIAVLLGALAPGRPCRRQSRTHPYTLDGRQVDGSTAGRWVEVGECGLARPGVLAAAGLPGALRDRIYRALHQGTEYQWAANDTSLNAKP